MKKSLLLTALLLICFPLISQAQQIIGDLDLENESQTHILTTRNGDQLNGRILSMGQDSLSFLFNANTLQFSRTEITNIQVVESESEEPKRKINWAKRYPSLNITGDLDLENEKQFQTLTTTRGNSFSGRVVEINDDEVKFLVSGRSTITFRFSRIKSIVVHGNVKPAESKAGASKDPEDVSTSALRNIMDADVTIGDSTQTHVIVTKRGDQFIGLVAGLDATHIAFKLNKSTPISLAIESLEQITLIENIERSRSSKVEDTSEIPMNGHENLFAVPTGFGLKKGQTEYKNLGLFVNTIDHGVVDNFSIGTGIVPVITSNSILLRTKVSASIGDYVHLSGTWMGIWTFYLNTFNDESETLWTAMGAISFGTEEQFLNISYGTWKPEYTNHQPVWSIGGSFRIHRKWRLYGNAIFIPKDDVFILPFGASWFNNAHRVDFGLFGAYDGYQPIVLPMAAYALRF